MVQKNEALAAVEAKLERIETTSALDALASEVGLSAADLRAALVWVVQERRKVRSW